MNLYRLGDGRGVGASGNEAARALVIVSYVLETVSQLIGVTSKDNKVHRILCTVSFNVNSVYCSLELCAFFVYYFRCIHAMCHGQ